MEYETSNWPEALINITAQGKAPKKYGEGVYRFGAAMTLSVILPKRGWELIKKTKNYVYLRPPKSTIESSFPIHISIPTQEQALNIALRCYEKGESWMGQLGEWPAWYIHERKRITNELVPSEDRKSIKEKFAYEFPPESSLCIGERGVWKIQVSKADGEFEISEYGEIVRDNSQKFCIERLVEGQELSFELTKQERNQRARERCIAYHGESCKVCEINFGAVYGKIGNGFIHVHHITQISQRKGEYEVDPIKDLIPLCPNCHAMAHRRNPPYNITELKGIVSKQRQEF